MSNSPINFIYWFAYYNLNSPSVRYRGKYPLHFYKEELGIDSYFVFPSYSIDKIAAFVKAYISALVFRRSNSIIVIQRVHSCFIYASLLKFLVLVRRNRTIYDLDDADYLDRESGTIYFFSKYCSMVSAGSKAIRNHLLEYNKNSIHVTSPILDLGIVKRKRNSPIVVGWIGTFGRGHDKSLIDSLFPALKALPFQAKLILLGVTQDSDIKFINDYFHDHPNIAVVIPRDINWNDEFEIQNRIIEFDIGIATLQNTPVQRAKSGIKAKQYLNNGVPVLCTDLPENNSVVIHEKNGYLCLSSEDFRKGIVRINNMSESLYSELSANARMSIINFNHEAYLEKLSKA